MEEICCERPPPAFSTNPVRFFDAHTHVQFAAFKDDRKEVLERALKNNVWVVNVGAQRDSSESALELAEKYPEGVWASVGLHPIHTEKSYHDAQELGAAPPKRGEPPAPAPSRAAAGAGVSVMKKINKRT